MRPPAHRPERRRGGRACTGGGNAWLGDDGAPRSRTAARSSRPSGRAHPRRRGADPWIGLGWWGWPRAHPHHRRDSATARRRRRRRRSWTGRNHPLVMPARTSPGSRTHGAATLRARPPV